MPLSLEEKTNNVAFLWDESHLWGLMAYKSLRALSLPFDLVRAEDIRQGCLNRYRMLFVPGGWASNKLKALGERGIEEIREFVKRGGNYFGICGGAGLATLDGIGLLNIKRKPTKERVPSFSGRIKLNISEHPIFSNMQSQKSTITTTVTFATNQQPTEIISGQSIERTRNTDTDNGIRLQPSAFSLSSAFSLQPIFYAWWPSQFVVLDSYCYFRHQISVIATFGEALPDAFSSDLNVGDVEIGGGSDRWKELEEIYGINLDPRRLINEPAVIEGNYGEGRVLLSLIHFDTPDDKNGAEVLKNIWQYLSATERQSDRHISAANSPFPPLKVRGGIEGGVHSRLNSSALLKEVEGLIDFGLRNLLWFWRTPMLLQWRRGVRGLEYCTLYWMIKEIIPACDDNELIQIRDLLIPFIDKAKKLLILERLAMLKENITFERVNDPVIMSLRKELFGGQKSYGGVFKRVLEIIDEILYGYLKRQTGTFFTRV